MSATSEGVLEGPDRATGKIKWTGTIVDLTFGSNSQLRTLGKLTPAATHRKRLCATLWQPGTS